MEHIVLGQNVLVKQKEALKTSDGGIVLPDASATKPLQGTIVGMGIAFAPWGTDPEQPQMQPMKKIPQMKEGDEILFDRYAGLSIVLDGEEYLVMSPEDILIILKGVK